jgi:hypothetical protein
MRSGQFLLPRGWTRRKKSHILEALSKPTPSLPVTLARPRLCRPRSGPLLSPMTLSRYQAASESESAVHRRALPACASVTNPLETICAEDLP